MDLLKRLVKEEEGQGMIEYVLIVALIAIVATVAVRAVGNSVGDVWNKTSNELDGALEE